MSVLICGRLQILNILITSEQATLKKRNLISYKPNMGLFFIEKGCNIIIYERNYRFTPLYYK